MLLYPLWFLLSTNFLRVEECQHHLACTSIAFVLKYEGKTVEGLPDDMTEEQCLAVKDELDSQTEAFTEMECVQVGIERQEL